MVDRAQTLYEILEVAPTATGEEIRASYHRLAARYHPDHHPHNPLAELAAEKLKQLNAAYEVLSDPARRAAYDSSGRTARHAPGATRETRTLATLRRILLLLVAVTIVVRIVPILWRIGSEVFIAGGEVLGGLAGTPALAIAVVLITAGALGWAWRRKRRKRG